MRAAYGDSSDSDDESRQLDYFVERVGGGSKQCMCTPTYTHPNFYYLSPARSD